MLSTLRAKGHNKNSRVLLVRVLGVIRILGRPLAQRALHIGQGSSTPPRRPEVKGTRPSKASKHRLARRHKVDSAETASLQTRPQLQTQSRSPPAPAPVPQPAAAYPSFARPKRF